MATISAQKKIEKQLEAFHVQLSRETAPFADTGKEAIKKRWEKAGGNTSAFMRTYCPHYVDAPDADFHADLDAMMNYPDQALFFLHGPREHAKSVRCRLNALRRVLDCDLRFFIFASETITKAFEHIEYLFFELTQNHRIASDFDIEIIKLDSQKGILRARVVKKATGQRNFFMMQAVADGTSAKGLTFMQYRPQGALVDDLEKTKDTFNRDNGRKKLTFVKQELYGACTGPVVWVGNIGNTNSALYQAFQESYEKDALEQLRKEGTEPGVFAEGCAENGGRLPDSDELEQIKGFIYRADTVLEDGSVRYLWPERFSPGWYKSKKKVLGWRYAGEYNGDPQNPGKVFNKFPSWDKIPEEAVWFSWFDPAWGRTKNSSHKCWIVGAYDGHLFYVADAYCRAGTPISEAIDFWYDAFDHYGDRGLLDGGFEDAYDQENRLSTDLEMAEEWQKADLPVRAYKNPGQKDVRILSIEMLVDKERIRWPKDPNEDVMEVKSQMGIYDPENNNIPKDGPDALAALVNNLRKRWRNARSSGPQVLSRRRYTARR